MEINVASLFTNPNSKTNSQEQFHVREWTKTVELCMAPATATETMKEQMHEHVTEIIRQMTHISDNRQSIRICNTDRL